MCILVGTSSISYYMIRYHSTRRLLWGSLVGRFCKLPGELDWPSSVLADFSRYRGRRKRRYRLGAPSTRLQPETYGWTPYGTPFWHPVRTTGSPGRYVFQARILRRSFATLIAALQRLIPVIARRRSASDASSNWRELPRRSAVSAWN